MTGPTASGKTTLAIALARAIRAEIINADSRQVYRGLDVGTAKPTADQQRRVRHHLFDVLDVTAQLTVGGWLKAARHVIGEIAERGQVPLVVGGPGLYLASLVLGYDPPPTGDESSVRASLQARLEGEGLGPLVRELVERDPNAGQVVDINNPRRVIRALEVIEITGQAFSTRGRQASPYPAVVVALDPPRAELDARVVARTHAMFEGGIQAETERAVAEGAGEGSPGFSGIGYPQALQLLRGEIDLDTAVEATVRATRILVRRQRNWLKRFPVALRLETWSEDEAVTSITRVWDERRGALVS